MSDDKKPGQVLLEARVGSQVGFMMPETVNLFVTKDILSRLFTFDNKGIERIVLDFSYTQFLRYTSYPMFITIGSKCKTMEIELRSEKASSAIRRQILNAGLESVFRFGETGGQPEKATAPVDDSGSVSTASARLDVKAVNGFIEGTMVAVKQIFRLDCKMEKPYLKSGDLFPGLGVYGSIAMNSDQVRGMVRLSLPQSFVFNLSRAYMNADQELSMEKLEEALESVELCVTMLFASARGKLAQSDLYLEHALPNVFVGVLAARSEAQATVLVLPFESHMGRFYLEVILAG